MSTRATYTIEEYDGNKRVHYNHFYIHHDGYSEGAATYFYKTFLKGHNQNLTTDFIRANDQAQLIVDPTRHGDTEFHYVLTDKGYLSQSARNFDSDSWTMIYHGSVMDFINKHDKFIDNASLMTYKKYESGVHYFPLSTKIKNISDHLNSIARNPLGTGNCRSNIASILKDIDFIRVCHDECTAEEWNFNEGNTAILNIVISIQPMIEKLDTLYELASKQGGFEDGQEKRFLELVKETVTLCQMGIATEPYQETRDGQELS